jgi:hypothetical protein
VTDSWLPSSSSCRVREKLELIRQLDLAARLLGRKHDETLEKYSRKVGDKPGAEEAGEVEGKGKGKRSPSDDDDDDVDAATLDEGLRRMQDKLVRCADMKVSEAVQVYDILDTHIRRIDSDLRRFEAHFGFAPRVEVSHTSRERE